MIARLSFVRRCFVSAALLLLLSAVSRAPARDAGKVTGLPDRVLVTDGSPVHDVGNVRVHASNWGAFGSRPGSSLYADAPSCEWPAGSGVDYVYDGGLWVGALRGGTPAVSTAYFDVEFRPANDPGDVVYRTRHGNPGGARRPSPGADDDGDDRVDEDRLDGYDDDSDRFADEDFAAVSDQMFSRRFRDDTPEAVAVYPDHRPLHLAVHEESYQWSDDDFDDFVGFTFWITAEGPDTLRDVYLGVYVDGDAGHRDRENYWEDDATGFGAVTVDHRATGSRDYDFAWWYDADGDGGQAPGYAGILILDHPTDPAGVAAPPSVRATTIAHMVAGSPYSLAGPPTNDLERYATLSRGTIGPNRQGDVASLISVGPFAQFLPGETIRFSFALVVTPRDDLTNAERAAIAFHGRWFDLDGDTDTGIDGREHQEPWYPPSDEIQTVAFGALSATAAHGVIALQGRYQAGMGVHAVNVYRGDADSADPLAKIGTAPPCGCGTAEYVDREVTAGASYRYQLGVVDGEGEHFSPVVGPTAGVAVAYLFPNRPNPFNPRTAIRFTLAERGTTTLAVYDVTGRRVRMIVQDVLPKGPHEVAWDGLDDGGRPAASGLYFCRLETATYTAARKMMLLK